MSPDTKSAVTPIADRIMLGLIAQMPDGGKLEVFMDAHNVTFVRLGADALGPGYITALPRQAFMLAAMSLAKEIEGRVDDMLSEAGNQTLDELASDMLVTHVEAAAAYPLSMIGDDNRDASTCVSEVASFGAASMACATCLDNPASIEDMLKINPSKSGG